VWPRRRASRAHYPSVSLGTMLLLAVGYAVAVALPAAPTPVSVTFDIGKVLSTTNMTLFGVTIDTHSLAMGLDWSAPALLTPSKALAPPLLRIGGSAQRSYPTCFNAAHDLEPVNSTCLTRKYWQALCDFSAAIGAKMLYGLDAHDTTGTAALLKDLDSARGGGPTGNACPALLGFSIGNEGVPGSNESFWAVREHLANFSPSATPTPLLVGPDSPMMPSNMAYFVPLATEILRAAGGALDGASFHLYSFCDGNRPRDSSVASVAKVKFFSKASLAVAAKSVTMMQAVLANTSTPHIPLWLSESNSICEGGVANLSNTYANTPWLLNQLGLLAAAGVPVMAQQTLIGSDYGLLSGPGDRTQNATAGWEAGVTARPNLFANLLHRTLIAPAAGGLITVLNASVECETAAAYAYCAGPGAKAAAAGAVVMVLINLDETQPAMFKIEPTSTVAAAGSTMMQLSVWSLNGASQPLPPNPSPKQVEDLITSPAVFLNGNRTPLSVEGVVASGMAPSVLAAGTDSVEVPGLGVAFVLVQGVAVSVCK
jgi:hypothetical protein